MIGGGRGGEAYEGGGGGGCTRSVGLCISVGGSRRWPREGLRGVGNLKLARRSVVHCFVEKKRGGAEGRKREGGGENAGEQQTGKGFPRNARILSLSLIE